jgi:poly(beta-D-mannuronate) lyase
VWTLPASAASYSVGAVAELQARLDAAKPGDVIVVRNGSYVTSAPITVKAVGVRIVAESTHGVEISGTHGFDVAPPAARVAIEGFVFRHTAGTTQIRPEATHVRFAHNVFECAGDGAYLTIAGDDAEIEANEFRNKQSVGNMIDVRGAGSQVARRVRIHHNYFHDFRDAKQNGAETIRFGLSGLSMSRGDGVIEHNLFERCTGENELISVKSGGNAIRYNTFLDSPGAQLTLRHGNENEVYGNILRGTDGIRIFGDRNRVFSNYLEGNSGGIQIGNGGAEVADGAPLTSHDRPDGTVIAFNTLVNNERQYFMTARPNGLGATRTVFADNVVQGGGVAASIEGPYTGAKWDGNIVWKTAGLGALPGGGYEEADPLLAPTTPHGILRPPLRGPACDSAKGEFRAPVDMDGQPRSGTPDRGADEHSNAGAAASQLTPEAVLKRIRGR